MSLVIETLIVDYEITEGTSEHDINAFLATVVIPEINSINEDEPSFFKTIPNQAPYPNDHKNAYFDCEQAFDEFYGNPASLEALPKYELNGTKIRWKQEKENGSCPLTRYLAWRTFGEFGKGDNFESVAVNQDMWDTWIDREIIGKDALIQQVA